MPSGNLKSELEVRPVYHWTPARVWGHIRVCFLALVMESALARLLRAHGGGEVSLAKVIEAVQEVKAVLVELNGDLFLTRTDLPPLAQKAFAAVGLRPPPKLQPLPV